MNKTITLLTIFLLAATAFAAGPLEKRVLPNGMTLITQEDHSRDLIAILTYVDGGNRTETPELSGLSHYFEHLIFRGGTDKQAELEMRKRFKALGTFYGYTFEDGTCYYIVVPGEKLPEAMDRYSDVLLNLKITEARTETERGIILEEFSQSYFDIPSGMAYYNLYRTAFTEHPYGMTTIGDAEVVRKATMETFQKFYDERYTPDHFVTAAVGNFDTDELLAEIEKTFGQHQAGGLDFETGKVEPPQDKYRQANHFMPVSTVNFALGFHSRPYSAPEFPALEILDHALADFTAGILNRKLAQEQGLFSYLYSFMDKTKDPGLWLFGGELPPDKISEAFPALFAEIGKVTENGLTDEQIASAKGELVRAYRQKRESFLHRAESYCFYELTSNLSLENLYIGRIGAVTSEEITALARRILTPENTTLSLVMPEGTEIPDGGKWAEKLRYEVKASVSAAGKWNPVEEFILPNGTVLLLQEDRASEMASLEIIVRGGLWAEPAGKAGVAEFLCRLLTRGTLEFKGDYFNSILGKYGISLSAGNNGDYCRMSVNSTAEVFLKGAELAGIALTRPGLRDDEIESVRAEILSEINSLPDQTYSYTRQQFDQLLYENNPYKRPVSGFEESIKSITGGDLRKFHRDNFSGNNIIISAAGNFDKSKLSALLGDLFGEIPAGEQFVYRPAEEKLPESPRVKVIAKERSQTTYDLGWTIPPVTHEDYLPLTFAQKMMGSTLFFRFVYEEGICYRMWTRNTARLGPGKFWFETGISPENYHFSQTGVLQEFIDYLNEPISDQMFSDARDECLQTLLIVNETTDKRAEYIAKNYLFGFGPDYIFRYPNLVKGVTKEEVKQAVKKYLKPDKYTLLVAGKTE